MISRSPRSVWLMTALTTTASCASPAQSPLPPPPPDLVGRTVTRPPGADDFANRSFAYPLSLDDAAAVLRRTLIFAVGGMPPKRQVQAFNVIFDQPDAAARFRAIGEGDRDAGKLYALAALRILDPAAGRALQASLSSNDQKLLVFDHDVVHVKTVRELAVLVRERDLGTEFRSERDETDRHFARAR